MELPAANGRVSFYKQKPKPWHQKWALLGEPRGMLPSRATQQ